jgi:hypothetical protein
MSDEPPAAEGETVRLPVSRRTCTIVEAVRRFDEAGVAVDDLGLRRPTLDECSSRSPAMRPRRPTKKRRRRHEATGLRHARDRRAMPNSSTRSAIGSYSS